MHDMHGALSFGASSASLGVFMRTFSFIICLILASATASHAQAIFQKPDLNQLRSLKAALKSSCSTAKLGCYVEGFSIENGFSQKTIDALLTYQYATYSKLEQADLLKPGMFTELKNTYKETLQAAFAKPSKEDRYQFYKTLAQLIKQYPNLIIYTGSTYSTWGNHRVMYFVIGDELLSISAGYSS